MLCVWRRVMIKDYLSKCMKGIFLISMFYYKNYTLIFLKNV